MILVVGGIVDVAEHSRGDWKMTDNADILAAGKDRSHEKNVEVHRDNY